MLQAEAARASSSHHSWLAAAATGGGSVAARKDATSCRMRCDVTANDDDDEECSSFRDGQGYAVQQPNRRCAICVQVERMFHGGRE